MIPWNDFARVELRAGTIVRAELFPEAHKPAFRLWIDLGESLGIRASSAQITDLYTPETLIGRQVLCVTNLAPRRIGPFVSEVLVCGFYRPDGAVVLVAPDSDVDDGSRLA